MDENINYKRDYNGGAGRNRKKKRRKKRRRRFPLGCLVIMLFFLVIAVIIGGFLWKRYSPSKKKADLKDYFNVTSDGQVAITADNTVLEEDKGILEDGKVYLPLSVINTYINERFYYDKSEGAILYTLPEDQIKVLADSKDYLISKARKSEDYVIFKVKDEIPYLALDFIKKYTNITYEVFDSPTRVAVVSASNKVKIATLEKDTEVRILGGVKSPILTEVKKGSTVAVLKNENDWLKVSTKSGFVGYLKTNTVSAQKDGYLTIRKDFETPKFTHLLLNKKINMVWHNVTNYDANGALSYQLRDSEGVNVVAPTWFHINDTNGDISSIASDSYINTAHQKDIDVWATIRDFDGGINSEEETLATLSSTASRSNIISELMEASLRMKLDGINVDFEKVNEECGIHFIQFIRELSVECRRNNIVLSVDNYVPMDFNSHYNRKEQGLYADYVIIMGYDEYYAGSKEAGPVSSYSYVKNGIESTLKDVDASQVISGVAFFSRLWKEEGGEVSSEAYGMSMAKSSVSEAGATPKWDDSTKLNYATWKVGGATYKIWIEDDKSLGEKLKLVKEYDLAGSAAWALGQEDASVWKVISEALS